jgi:hypothetical protein
VLRQDGCGYAGIGEVARTTHQPRGRTWSGSIQAVKRLVLEDQATSEAPEPMSAVRKKCEGEGERRDADAGAGRRARARWISRAHPSMLDVLGSEHAVAACRSSSRTRRRRPVFDERTAVVDQRARPGARPLRVTLAKPVGASVESVALATLVAGDRPTVRWRYVLTSGSRAAPRCGLHADGHPTRYVLDCEHLDWPKPPKKEKA